MPASIDVTVKLFFFLFVCGVTLSCGSLIDTMTDLQSFANPSTNASTNATADTCFFIKFGTKPCEDEQKSVIEKVTTYFTRKAPIINFVVQPTNSQNGSSWCLTVYVRSEPDAFKKDTASKSIRRSLRNVSGGNFSIYTAVCDPSQSRILDQSVGQEASIESRNLPSMTPATLDSSGTNAGIKDSGDPIRLLLPTRFLLCE